MGGRPAVSVTATVRILRPTHAITTTAVSTSTGRAVLLATDLPRVDAAGASAVPGAEEGLAFNKSELDEAVRTDAEGEQKRPGFAGPKLDAGGSQGRVDGALAVFGLEVVLALVVVVNAAAVVGVAAVAAVAAVRDVAGVLILLLFHLFNLGAAAVQRGAWHGSLTLEELPRS